MQAPCRLTMKIGVLSLGIITLFAGTLALVKSPGLSSLNSLSGILLIGCGVSTLLALTCLPKANKSTRDARKLPEEERIKPKTQVNKPKAKKLVPDGKSLYDVSGADFVESEAIRRSAEDDGNLDKLSRPSTKPSGERCPEKPKDFCGRTLTTDEEIIADLVKQGYSRPIEEGGKGRCLFHSILPQLTDADIKKGLSSKYARYFLNWESLPKDGQGDDRLDRLRQMALADEENFINFLRRESSTLSVEQFNHYQKDRIFELYKDMLQELEDLKDEAMRQRIEITNLRDQFDYCVQNFKRYKECTSRKYNWSGTSELIAIGRVLEREVIAFGRDIYPTTLDDQGNVLPYYRSVKQNSLKTSSPIVIFQTGGGGHYRRLIAPGS